MIQIAYLEALQRSSIPLYVFHVLDVLERVRDFFCGLYRNIKDLLYLQPSLHSLAWGWAFSMHNLIIRRWYLGAQRVHFYLSCWQIYVQLFKSSIAMIFQLVCAIPSKLFNREFNTQPAKSLSPALISPAPAHDSTGINDVRHMRRSSVQYIKHPNGKFRVYTARYRLALVNLLESRLNPNCPPFTPAPKTASRRWDYKVDPNTKHLRLQVKHTLHQRKERKAAIVSNNSTCREF